MSGKAFANSRESENESIEIVPGRNAPCFFADARPDAIPGQKDPEGHLFFHGFLYPVFPKNQLPGLERFSNRLRGFGLTDGHQPDFIQASIRFLRSLLDRFI